MSTETSIKISADIRHDKILILDFGSQYTQLIARRVRELGVYCELMSSQCGDEAIAAYAPNGIILSGGPESVTQDVPLKAPQQVFERGCPVLGICYGLQTMVAQLGGTVASASKQEFGHAPLKADVRSALFSGLSNGSDSFSDIDVWMSHGDHVTTLPSGFQTIAQTENSPHAAVENAEKRWYGLQFHPEVTHTPQGSVILSQFVHQICGCSNDWSVQNIIDDMVEDVRQKVGNDKVLVALSGGVDSSVLAVLLHKAIGDQLTCVFVDTGLLRRNEATEVMQVFREQMGIDVHCVQAGETFLKKLEGVTDPEAKRKVIGEKFIRTFEAESAKLNDVAWLAQGTIYPDVIESAQSVSGKAHVIKSHHNVGGLPEDMSFELIEPLRELFKDEVRKIGLALGLTESIVFRHPFPGPGLALRIIGEITPKNIDILQRVDEIFIEELRAAQLYFEVNQAFAVFLPIKSVGVKGDARCYEYVIALRAVKTVDYMTAHWAELPYDFLSKVSHRIINETPEVSRVVYDISGKPPATIEWE